RSQGGRLLPLAETPRRGRWARAPPGRARGAATTYRTAPPAAAAGGVLYAVRRRRAVVAQFRRSTWTSILYCRAFKKSAHRTRRHRHRCTTVHHAECGVSPEPAALGGKTPPPEQPSITAARA